MFKRNSKRKKASIILEFIIVIPAIYIAAWCCMLVIFYSMAQNTVHQAAIEGARILTQELRGNTGKIPNDTATKELLSDKVKISAGSFRYVLLFHDDKFNEVTPQIIIEPADCMTAVKNKTRVICAYTASGTASGIEQQQIVVVIKAKFYVIGTLLPSIRDSLYTTGKGSSEKEISGRFKYW